MKKQLEPQKRQQEKNTQSQSPQHVGLEGAVRTPMSSQTTAHAIPIGEDSFTTMTDAPMQCKKGDSRAKKKLRKEQEQEYNAALEQNKLSFTQQLQQSKDEAQDNPDNPYLSYRANALSYADVNAFSSRATRSNIASKNVYRAQAIAPVTEAKFLGATYGRDAAFVMGDLAGEEEADMEAINQYASDEYILTAGKHRGNGSANEDREATEQEVSEAYQRSVEVHITQVDALLDFVNSHGDVFNNHNMTPAKMVEFNTLAFQLNTKAQQVSIGIRQRMKEPDYQRLDPVVKGRLFTAFLQHEALDELRGVGRVFSSTLSREGSLPKTVDEVEKETGLQFKDINLDTMMDRARKRVGTIDNPNTEGNG